ncbi:MAG TPA: hypothetical protein VFB06_14055 [Streptosporangiaceae bacterium]|nr:hypothetical protein [Streptosporangiaceae bacterium]
MAGMLQVRRSRGALGGVLLILLGAWGALIPFIGPYFHYAYTPDKAWTYNTGRLWLEILPGAAAFVGGLLLVGTMGRHTKLFGAVLAVVAGAWFAVGNVLAPLWTTAAPAGAPASTTTLMRSMEEIGFFTGLGVAIVMIAAAAAGRLTAVPGVAAAPVTAPDEPVETVPAQSFRSEPIERDEDATQTLG